MKLQIDGAYHGQVIFESKEYVPCGPPIEITMDCPDAIYETKSGEKLKVLDKNEEIYTIKVRTRSGIVGWMGGNHLVWD